MIFDEQQVRWLAVARAQSLRLADARAALPRPWRPAARSTARHPLRWAMAGALTFLLLASGAWALVAHTGKPIATPPPPPPVRPRPVAPRAPTPAVASAPTPPAKNPRRKDKEKKPQRPRIFEDGDGELILVAPHEPPPPLFSPEEWKRRGSSQP